MALKDLVADASKLDESAIENVIAKFVRYDPKAERIIFTPNGVELSSENKILVYLTAVAGWSFINETPPNISTKPSDLESVLGIAGGTLRPALKKLTDMHLLANNSGRYSVQSGNMSHIDSYVRGDAKPLRRKTGTKKSSSSKTDTSPKTKSKSSKLKTSKSGGSALDAFNSLIDKNFFGNKNTLKDLKKKLEEQGLIFPQSALSGLVLKAVRAEVLKREKIESDGRKIWAYSNHE